jgi:geranylgeranylglycerol-phosphate geranylgeranyltransferase
MCDPMAIGSAGEMTPNLSAFTNLCTALKSLRGIVFVIHPFPALINALAGTLFYLIAADLAQGIPVASIFLSILLIHASIGSMNDFCDIDLDAKTKPRKPIVRGDIGPRAALVISCVAAIAGTLLSLSFSWSTLVVALAVLISGMAYNFWAKGTVYSWVPYSIFIPALPVWAFVAADSLTPAVLFSFPLGALMSLALNIANTIPDLQGDAQYGLQGLAHRLGLEHSLLVLWSSLAGTIILLALTPRILGNNATYLLPGTVLGGVLLVVMILDRLLNRSDASLRRGWYLSAVIAVILGGAWVASLPSG